MTSEPFRPCWANRPAAFRILFCSITLWEVFRYFDYDWIERYWVIPAINFTDEGFFMVESDIC
ncbi:hypothetical protein BH23BAC3_BH23BAC3_17330 [soil metagenome]